MVSPNRFQTRRPLAIVGTDTNAGKTIVSTALAAYWETYRDPATVALVKPVQSGVGDIERYRELFGDRIKTANSVYLREPLAPPIAAERDGVAIDLGAAWQELQAIAQQHPYTIVEWLGGLGSPVTWELTVADLVRDWRMSALLVVPIRLGSISQAVACAALARDAKVAIAGIVLNCLEPIDLETRDTLAPIAAIERLTYLPVLGCIPFLSNVGDRNQLIAAASDLNLAAIGD